MDIPPLQTHVRADQLPLEQLNTNTCLNESEKIGELARQFEAVLVRQILSEARKSVISDGLGENNATLGIYQDLINQSLADSISRNGMVGLATSLQAQLTRQNATSTPGASEPQP